VGDGNVSRLEPRGRLLTSAKPRFKGKIPTVEEEHSDEARGYHAEEDAEIRGGSGWVNTKVAAEALGVDPRTVRVYIERGDLQAKSEGEGVNKTYLVSIDSVYALRELRGHPRKTRRDRRERSAGVVAADDLTVLIRELTAELVQSSTEAADLRARLELTERAESSLREALEQRLETEWVLRERVERERDELRAQQEALRANLEAIQANLEAIQETRESSMRGSVDVDKGEATSAHRSSWWRRFFGSS
jgi:hypothetical protein